MLRGQRQWRPPSVGLISRCIARQTHPLKARAYPGLSCAAPGFRSTRILLDFESGYERIGMPALILQVLTGLWMAHAMLPDIGAWFAFDTLPSRLVVFKLALLAVTVGTHARRAAARHPALDRGDAAFVLVGVSFRGGLLG